MRKWTHDPVMRALVSLPEPVGSLVAAFPGRETVAEQLDWIDNWFLDLTRSYADDTAPEEVQITTSGAAEQGADHSPLAKTPVNTKAQLISIRPHFFRGFRILKTPINLDAGLTVVEGRNSSGKTSISEAIEWVFTGALSRRKSNYGHPRELANCIANEFRPSKETTWVEICLRLDDKEVRLRRTLLEDYTSKSTSVPKSILAKQRRAYYQTFSAKRRHSVDARKHWKLPRPEHARLSYQYSALSAPES